MIEAVVFDMDGVLADYRLERRLELLSSWCGRAPQEIRAAIWDSGFEDASERGEIDADAYLSGFGERMGYALTAAEWVRARRDAMMPNEPLLAVARRLGEARPVGMFTNNGFLLKRHFGEVFPAASALFGVRACFSAEVGASKPSPEAFRRLAAKLGVAPDRLLFFDDSPTYVEGAREAGLHAHRYDGLEGLLARLDEHDLGRIARG